MINTEPEAGSQGSEESVWRTEREQPGLFRTVVDLLTGQQSSLERLRAEIEPVHTEIEVRRRQEEARKDERETARGGRDRSHWLDGAHEQVHYARLAAEDGRAEVGWRSLLQARRLLVHSYDASTAEGRHELRSRGAAVRTEAEEKLDGWRLDVVRELLTPPKGTGDDQPDGPVTDRSSGSGSDPPESRGSGRTGSDRSDGSGMEGPSGYGDEAWTPSPEAIYAAAEVLDARHGNVHRRVAHVRKQVLALVLVEFVGVLGVLAVATLWQSPFVAAAGSAALLVSVALFGLMGASAGRLVSLVTAGSAEKIPTLAINWWMTVGRTLMGAAAALALYAFVHSGVVAVGGVDIDNPAFQALVLAVAFAAGFSERLLESAVDVLGGTNERPSAEEPPETNGDRKA